MKIVITGHLGFIGSYLTKRIDGIGLDLKNGNNILTCDLPDADIVIHLAAQTSVLDSLENPEYDATNNIVGTIRLANKYKKSRFIYISSGGAIQETIESPYGMSKYCAEQYVKMICKNYVILRLPNIFGVGSKSVVDKFINSDITVYGKGNATRDYVYVEDIVEAIIQSMEWDKGLYSLGSGENINVLEIAKATGKKIKYIPAKKGELLYSYVPNNSPWKSKVKVLDYIKSKI